MKFSYSVVLDMWTLTDEDGNLIRAWCCLGDAIAATLGMNTY